MKRFFLFLLFPFLFVVFLFACSNESQRVNDEKETLSTLLLLRMLSLQSSADDAPSLPATDNPELKIGESITDAITTKEDVDWFKLEITSIPFRLRAVRADNNDASDCELSMMLYYSSVLDASSKDNLDDPGEIYCSSRQGCILQGYHSSYYSYYDDPYVYINCSSDSCFGYGLRYTDPALDIGDILYVRIAQPFSQDDYYKDVVSCHYELIMTKS